MKNFLLGICISSILFLSMGAAVSQRVGPYQLVVDKWVDNTGFYVFRAWAIDQSSGDIYQIKDFHRPFDPKFPMKGQKVGSAIPVSDPGPQM